MPLYLASPDDNTDDSLIAERHGILTFDSVLGGALQDGNGVISGTVTIDGDVPATFCMAVLIAEETGAPMAATPVNEDGTYEFVGVAPGNWAVTIVDTSGSKRAKVVHTSIV